MTKEVLLDQQFAMLSPGISCSFPRDSIFYFFFKVPKEWTDESKSSLFSWSALRKMRRQYWQQ